ncbi:hypothetical protein FB451DRAFT_1564132 [Mycena latifolia]|nr:hypothetical protein FB451DRAFT_1564132 [Mycena latifolia]
MPSPQEIDSLLEYTRIAATTLQDACGPNAPLLNAVSGATMLIVSVVQDLKGNREQCVRMVERIHQLLCTLTMSGLNSESSVTPQVLDNIGRFAEYLNKFYACLRSQQELGRVKRFFKQTEITTQLEAYEAELQAILETFKVQSITVSTTTIVDLCIQAEQRHQEILEILATRSNTQSSDTTSMVGSLSQMSGSSLALSLLPASPQIFYGRDSELEEVVSTLMEGPARVAILGTGGIGKTALALATLHHRLVQQKYAHRHFVSCESANSGMELISAVRAHLGLEPSRQLSRMIVRHFWDSGPAVLVLDNMETSWEPVSNRANVEEFLSSLTDVPHLALLITMRGAERPGKVKWTRPFLPPLESISPEASYRTFVDIADEPVPDEQPAIAELIELTGNLPLAVGLMANVASFEGYLGALTRWKTETTALLSDGYHKTSNLEKSIAISLTSPRFKSNPHALDLLSLLSLLPDGITEAELLASRIPLPGIPDCISILLQTALAFLVQGRLKTLSLICDYMRGAHPASITLTRPLRTHFQGLLKVWESYHGLSPRDLVPQLTSQLGNIQSIFLNSVTTERMPDPDVGFGIITLDVLSVVMLKGGSDLMQYLPGIIDTSHDQHLKWRYALTNQGTQYFIEANDPEGQASAYISLETYYHRANNIHKALEFNRLAMNLATQINHFRYQVGALLRSAEIESILGQYHESLGHFRQAEKLARLTGKVYDECLSVANQAIPLCRLGKFAEALECASEGRKLLVDNGLSGSNVEVNILDRKAEIHFQKSEYAEARELNELVVRMTARGRSPYFHANAVRTLAQLDIITGMGDSVILPNLRAARALAIDLESPHALLLCDILQGEWNLLRGNPSTAYSSLKPLAAQGKVHAEIVFLALESLGELSHGMCGLDETFRWATIYFAFARKTEDLGHTYQALRYLGDIFLVQGDEKMALSVFQAVLNACTEMDVHRRRADCMSRIGDIYVRRGDPTKANEMWQAARPLFVRSSRPLDVSSIDSKLARLIPGAVEMYLETMNDRRPQEMDCEAVVRQRPEAGDGTKGEIADKSLSLRVPNSQPGLDFSETEAETPASMENEKIGAGY